MNTRDESQLPPHPAAQEAVPASVRLTLAAAIGTSVVLVLLYLLILSL